MSGQANVGESEKFEVFYDAQCPLCKKEIDMVRWMDTRDRLILTDIADEQFDPQSVGKPLDTLMREIHGRHPNGRWVIGVEVFREIYGRVGFQSLASVSKWPVISSLLDLGYACFAWPRYKLAVRRMKKAALRTAVDSGESCGVGGSKSACQQFQNAASVSEPVASAPAE